MKAQSSEAYGTRCSPKIKQVQTVICMKWGTRYGAEFVNRLHAAIQRNTSRATQLVCLTDDKTDIDGNVRCVDLSLIHI